MRPRTLKPRSPTPEVSLGRFVGALGLRGELKLQASRIGVSELREGLSVTLSLPDGVAHREARIVKLRVHKNGFIATLEGIESANDAQALVGASLMVPRETISLGEGEYFDDDLIGCRLVEGERTLGVVRGVLHYPAQDVLELEGGALVPLVAAFVRAVDVGARIVYVELPPGLVGGEPEIA